MKLPTLTLRAWNWGLFGKICLNDIEVKFYHTTAAGRTIERLLLWVEILHTKLRSINNITFYRVINEIHINLPNYHFWFAIKSLFFWESVARLLKFSKNSIFSHDLFVFFLKFSFTWLKKRKINFIFGMLETSRDSREKVFKKKGVSIWGMKNYCGSLKYRSF